MEGNHLIHAVNLTQLQDPVSQLRRRLCAEPQSTPGLRKQRRDGRKLWHQTDQAGDPVTGEPAHNGAMVAGNLDQVLGLKRVRQIGGDQDKIAIVVGPDMISHKAQSAAVHRKGQLEFRMVMPVERKLWQAAVEDMQGPVRRDGNGLEVGWRYGHYIQL